MRALVRLPGAGERLQGPAGGPLTFKLRAAESDGVVTVMENVVGPGDGPPLHTHARESESWQVLEGEIRVKLGETIEHAPAGTFVFVPAGVPHCFQNVGTGQARILVVFTPSGMEGLLEQLAALPPGGIDPETFAALGREFGMTVVGPPLSVSDPLD